MQSLQSLQSFRTAVANSRPDSRTPHQVRWADGSSLTLAVDYLAIHFDCRTETEAIALAEYFLGLANDPADFTKVYQNCKYGKVWDRGVNSALGARVLWDLLPDSVSLCLVLKGATLSRIPDLRSALLTYRSSITHASRVDLALDGGDYRALRALIYSAIRDGRAGRVRKFAYHQSGHYSDPYETLEVGSRDSDVFLRIYDKDSPLERFTRVEVELKREMAGLALCAIFDSAEIPFYFSALAKFQFYQEKKVKNLSRNTVLPEWRAFLRGAERVRLEKQSEKDTITTSLCWLHRQVSKTLARLRLFFGVRFPKVLLEILADGDSRLNAYDLRLVECERRQALAVF